MRIVAIIGSTGAGKSTILNTFKNIQIPGLQIHTVNLDQVAKDLRSTSEPLKHNLKHFHWNALDKDYILNKIFPADKLYRDLNAIYDPFLYTYLKDTALHQAAVGCDLMVVEGTSLIHSQRLLDLFDLVIQADLEELICYTRVQARGNYTDEQILLLLKRTNPDANEKLEYKAFHRIPTNTNMLTLHYNVERALFRVLMLDGNTQMHRYICQHFGINIYTMWDVIKYRMSGRPYHNAHHTESVFINTVLRLQYAIGVFYEKKQYCFNAVIASLYHDVIYEPGSSVNELLSVTFLNDNISIEATRSYDCCSTASTYIMLSNLIWHDVKNWPIDDPYAKAFLLADLAVFTYSYDALIDYEKAIRNEFDYVDECEYQHYRILFLQDKLLPLIDVALHDSATRETMVLNVHHLIDYVSENYNKTDDQIDNDIQFMYPNTVTSQEIEMPKSNPIAPNTLLNMLNMQSLNSVDMSGYTITGIEQPDPNEYVITKGDIDNKLTVQIHPGLGINKNTAPIRVMVGEGDRVAIYQGSFDPLHVGHLDIINQALRIFDKVILLRCINGAKPISVYQEFDIAKLPDRVSYDSWTGSFVDYLKIKTNSDVTIVRGIRNGTDLQYENDYIKHLQSMFYATPECDIFPPVVYLPAISEHSHVSSSAIKAIIRFSPEYAESLMV